jgi:hypothetical protein
MPDETISVYRKVVDEDHVLHGFELEFRVDCWIAPGQDGATGPHGEPLEPSFPPHVEDWDVKKVRIVSSNHVGLWHHYEQCCEHYDLHFRFFPDELFELCNNQTTKREGRK